ncbi:hypothetical protein EON82_01690 [bacterium]|nr:MAG: hypothetical protein EON82_01690 [bacterium]
MKKIREGIVVGLAVLLVGCNVGNAPETMSEADVKAAIDKMSPQEQIDYINRSPLTPDEKKKRIADLEAKSGAKAESSGP